MIGWLLSRDGAVIGRVIRRRMMLGTGVWSGLLRLRPVANVNQGQAMATGIVLLRFVPVDCEWGRASRYALAGKCL